MEAREDNRPLRSNLWGALASFCRMRQHWLGLFRLACLFVDFAECCQSDVVLRRILQNGLELFLGAVVLSGDGVRLAEQNPCAGVLRAILKIA